MWIRHYWGSIPQPIWGEGVEFSHVKKSSSCNQINTFLWWHNSFSHNLYFSSKTGHKSYKYNYNLFVILLFLNHSRGTKNRSWQIFKWQIVARILEMSRNNPDHFERNKVAHMDSLGCFCTDILMGWPIDSQNPGHSFFPASMVSRGLSTSQRRKKFNCHPLWTVLSKMYNGIWNMCWKY